MTILMNQIDAETLINEELPLKTRSFIAPAIWRAYNMVRELYIEKDWLDWRVGHDILRELRRVAVEFEIKKLVDSGRLPLTYNITPNAISNCRHLELFTNRCIITISQVVSQHSVPRDAIFRSNHSLSNQLEFDFYGEGSNIIKDTPYYILITHGYKRDIPDFITIGVPEPRIKGWMAYIDLLKEPNQVDLSNVELINDDEVKLEFKEHIQGVLRNGT